MPLLIKSVNGKVLDNLTDNINNIKFVKGTFGNTDWFKIGNLEVFLQDLKKTIHSEKLLTPSKHGINIKNNKPQIILEISY